MLQVDTTVLFAESFLIICIFYLRLTLSSDLMDVLPPCIGLRRQRASHASIQVRYAICLPSEKGAFVQDEYKLCTHTNCALLFVTLWTVARRLLCPWNFPNKNNGVGCHFLPQELFLTRGSNSLLLCLLHFRKILYLLSHWGNPPN